MTHAEHPRKQAATPAAELSGGNAINIKVSRHFVALAPCNAVTVLHTILMLFIGVDAAEHGRTGREVAAPAILSGLGRGSNGSNHGCIELRLQRLVLSQQRNGGAAPAASFGRHLNGTPCGSGAGSNAPNQLAADAAPGGHDEAAQAARLPTCNLGYSFFVNGHSMSRN
jgi:hypothetical protein